MSTTDGHLDSRKCSDVTKEELEKSEDILSIQQFYILPIAAFIGLIAHYIVARVFIRLGLEVRYNILMLVYTVGRALFIFTLVGYALPLTSICPYLEEPYSFPFIYFRLLYVFDFFGNCVWVTMPNIILLERIMAVSVLPSKMRALLSIKLTKIAMACYIVLFLVYCVVCTHNSKQQYSLEAAYENRYTKCGNETIFDNDCITKGEHCIFEITWNRHILFTINPKYLAFAEFIYSLTPVFINIFGCLVLVVLLHRASKRNRTLTGKRNLDLRAHVVVIVSCVDFCFFQTVANPMIDNFRYITEHARCGMGRFNYDIRLEEFENSILLVSCCLQCVYPVVFSSKFRKALFDFLPARVRDSGVCKQCHRCKVKTCLCRETGNNESRAQSESTKDTHKKTAKTEGSAMYSTEESTSRSCVVNEKSGHGDEVVETFGVLELALPGQGTGGSKGGRS